MAEPDIDELGSALRGIGVGAVRDDEGRLVWDVDLGNGVEATGSVAARDGGWRVGLTTAPFVPAPSRDLVVAVLRASGTDHDLPVGPDRRTAVALWHDVPAVPALPARPADAVGADDPAPAEALATEVRDRIDDLRPLAREVERELFVTGDGTTTLRDAARLHEAGQLGDAIRLARRGVAELRAGASPRLQGTYRGFLGEMLAEEGSDEAPALLEEGVALLEGSGQTWLLARLEIALVQAALTHDRYDLALDLATKAGATLARVGSESDRTWADIRLAQVLIALQRPAEAQERLYARERRLAGRPASIDLARTRQAIGLMLAEMGDHDSALPLLASAERLFSRFGDEQSAFYCQSNGIAVLIRAQRYEEALVEIRRCRSTQARWSRLVDPGAAARIDSWESVVLQALRRTSEAAALGDRAAAAAPPGSLQEATTQANLGKRAIATGDLRTALHHLAIAAQSFERLDHPVDFAVVKRDMAMTRLMLLEADWAASGNTSAVLLVDPAVLEEAHADALAAVRAVEHRPPRRSVADRERWAAVLSTIFGSAFHTSFLTGRYEVGQSLLESVRAQGLPDLDATALTRAGFEDPDDTDASAPTTPEDHALHGVLAASCDFAVSPPRIGVVCEQTRRIGGPDAWRWTLWQSGGVIMWALETDRGRVEAGEVMLAKDASHLEWLHPSTQALLDQVSSRDFDRLRRATGVGLDPGSWESTIADELLLADAADAEPAVAWAVGSKLIPPRLLAELRERAASPDLPRLPLVVAAAPGVAQLPYALLAIGPATEAVPLGPRLVEAAIVTLAPPPDLADTVTDRADAGAGPPPFDVRMAVVDSADDLEHLAGLLDGRPDRGPEGAFFGGRRVRERSELPVAPARREAVIEGLRGMTPGEDGVLVWAGHAVDPPDGNPLHLGLRLAGRRTDASLERLTSRDVIFERLPVPRRVVLLACSSLGADLGPVATDGRPPVFEAREWWGLPVALLYAGAGAVLATMWKAIDSPATTAIAARLVDAARTAPDLATALHEIQVDCLRQWRAQRAQGRALRSTADDRHPHLWAGWAVTGVRDG